MNHGGPSPITMVFIMIQRSIAALLTVCAGLAWGSLALAQDIGSGTTGTTGGTSTGSGTVNTGSLGGSGSGGFGGGMTGGAGDSFLGTSGTQPFITSGYEPGALGHAAKAGAGTTTTNTGALFSRFYVNPYALGMTTTGNTRPTTFGTPLYTSLYPGTQTTNAFGATGAGATGAGGRAGAGGGVGVTPGVTGTVGTTRAGGAGGLGGVGGITGGLGGLGGTGATGFRPPAAYQTAIAFRYNPTTPPQRQLALEAILARSTTLGARSIRVEVDGPAVILRGTVADPADRRRAENLLRLTPGVRVVKNELTVTGP